MDKYHKILNLSLSTNEDFLGRQWMQKPFIVGDNIYSTNGQSLVFFDKSYIEDISTLEVFDEEKVEKAIPKPNIDKTISIEYLKECFAQIPLIDDWDEVEEDKECVECDGFGVVDFTYNEHLLEGECPVCKGEGSCLQTVKKMNGKKIYDFNANCIINNCKFSVLKIENILKIAEILDVKEIQHISQISQGSPGMFKIGNVKLVIAPEYFEYAPQNTTFII